MSYSGLPKKIDKPDFRFLHSEYRKFSHDKILHLLSKYEKGNNQYENPMTCNKVINFIIWKIINVNNNSTQT